MANNYKVKMIDLQNKYKFKIFCASQMYDDSELKQKLDTIYQAFPKASATGTSASLDGTANAPMNIDLKGNTSQTGTPTPNSPIPVNVVTGDNTINITGKNLLEGIELGDINSSTGVPSSSSNSYRSLNFIEYDTSKTYYVSINGATLSATLNIRMYNKNYEYIGYGTLIGSGSNFNITKTTAVVDDTPKYFKFRTAVANVPSVDAKIMISTLSDLIYEPYKGNTYPISLGSIELCKIGDYQDYIYKENDKWYKYGAIGKVVLDGTEANWSTRGGATTYAYSCPSIFDGNKASGLCSHWNFISGGATNSQANECVATANTNTSIAIFTNNSSLDTLANLKTWLGNNTPTIYYVLATPTTTQITDATLISQLEALKGAESYKEQTNISQVNNDEAFIISASALKDLSNL